MKISSLKRIITEDFGKDSQELVSKLSFIINPIIDQLTTMFDKRLDYINLNRQLKSITLKVDPDGKPFNTIQIKSELKTKAVGVTVIRAINTNSSSSFVTTCPFVSFSEDSSLISINNIKGLPSSQEFTLTLEIIGDNT